MMQITLRCISDASKNNLWRTLNALEVEQDSYGWVNTKVRCVEYNKALASKSNFTESKDKSNERSFYFTISRSVHHPAVRPRREERSCTRVIIHGEDQREHLKPTGSFAWWVNQMLYEEEWLLNSNKAGWRSAAELLPPTGRERSLHVELNEEYVEQTVWQTFKARIQVLVILNVW